MLQSKAGHAPDRNSGCHNMGSSSQSGKAVQQMKSALRNGDIVGQVQHERAGFWLDTNRLTWHRATPAQKRGLVVKEIQWPEKAEQYAKAFSQAKQDQWTRWENLDHRKLSWRDLWEMEGGKLSFIIKAIYNVLPSPKNLNQWHGAKHQQPYSTYSPAARLASPKGATTGSTSKSFGIHS